MAKVRVEWITLGVGPLYNGKHENVLDEIVQAEPLIDVTTTATAPASRPLAPAGELVHARITAVTGDVIAAWGPDPTAAQTNGVLVLEGGVELVPVVQGDRLSFVELTGA